MVRIWAKKVEDKKEQHLEAEHLMRQVVQSLGGQLPVEYERNSHGKPYLLEPNAHIYVNWSHSGEYVICAAADCEIGIDLQIVKTEPKESLVRRTLQPQELLYYESVPDEEQKVLFYQYWTVKESFLKALGTGFSAGLKEFVVQMGEEQPQIVQSLNEKRYVCRLLEFIDSDYVAAVCSEQELEEIQIEYI